MGKKSKTSSTKLTAEDETPSTSSSSKPPPSKKPKLEEGKTEEKKDQESTGKNEEVVNEAEKLHLLVSAFSSQQQDQYEIFRRSTFQKSTVRRLIQSISGGTVSQNVVIAMAGMAKVYVGEIVESACIARDRLNETGPLRPKHIRQAVQMLRKQNKIPCARYKKITFKY